MRNSLDLRDAELTYPALISCRNHNRHRGKSVRKHGSPAARWTHALGPYVRAHLMNRCAVSTFYLSAFREDYSIWSLMSFSLSSRQSRRFINRNNMIIKWLIGQDTALSRGRDSPARRARGRADQRYGINRGIYRIEDHRNNEGGLFLASRWITS